MVITVIGAGYVGLTDAAIFANAGFKVYAIDVNQERIDIIKSGKSFFHEANLDSLIASAVTNGSLVPTMSYEEALAESDIVFSCVGTPDNPDGSSNLTYVYEVVETVAKIVGESHKTFVQKSTVPVGTGEKIEHIFQEHNANIAYVSNPEFLREGSAIVDSLWFDRIVVGSKDHEASERVINVYRQVTGQRGNIATLANLSISHERDTKNGEYITTSVNSAELIKVTANAFLATKITFANSIAKLADATNADIVEVMNAVGADPRIGKSFLNAGRGFGGGCFPKDVSGLLSSGIEYGVNLNILHAVIQENDSMPGYIVEKAMESAGGSLAGKVVTVLGLAYKAGTSDVRRSPSIKIANLLVDQAGATVRAYDPVAVLDLNSKDLLNENVSIIDNLEEAISSSDVIFVATEWPEFTALPASKYSELMAGKTFVDCMNCFAPEAIRSAGLTYVGVGR
jgi:UDPglucose 6-dehydrogenase